MEPFQLGRLYKINVSKPVDEGIPDDRNNKSMHTFEDSVNLQFTLDIRFLLLLVGRYIDRHDCGLLIKFK